MIFLSHRKKGRLMYGTKSQKEKKRKKTQRVNKMKATVCFSLRLIWSHTYTQTHNHK